MEGNIESTMAPSDKCQKRLRFVCEVNGTKFHGSEENQLTVICLSFNLSICLFVVVVTHQVSFVASAFHCAVNNHSGIKTAQLSHESQIRSTTSRKRALRTSSVLRILFAQTEKYTLSDNTPSNIYTT